MKDYRSAFYSQRNTARERGIEFLLTFDEWLQIWLDSGHLQERGRKCGQYCMARFGDKGPYAIGNVKIILHGENLREALVGNDHTLGLKMDLESRKRMSDAAKGKSKPTSHKEGISKGQTLAWARRKICGYVSPMKGLSYEEIYGFEKAAKLKEAQRKRMTKTK